jgi:hypothetical protein
MWAQLSGTSALLTQTGMTGAAQAESELATSTAAHALAVQADPANNVSNWHIQSPPPEYPSLHVTTTTL